MSELRRELWRKGWHVLLLAYLLVFLLAGRRTFLRWMLPWTLFVLAVETLRLRWPALDRALTAAFGPILREHERRGYTGMAYTALGVLFAAAFYGHEPRIVGAAVLYLAFADAAAALVGVAWGRRRFAVAGRSRSLEGAAAGCLVAAACGAAAGLGPGAVAAGAAAFCLVDCLPLPPDDNLWIPVVTSLALGAATRTPPSLPW